MIRAIIFDFFDVIRTDAYKAWLSANHIPHEGPYFELSHQQDLGNLTVEGFLQGLSELSGRIITREELDKSAAVDQAVVTILKGLRPTYKTALLSNAPSVLIREILTEHSLEQYFDEIVVSSEVGLVKPSAEIFGLTLARLDVDVTEAVFIDDNPKHVEAAEELGITGLVFTSAKQLQNDLASLNITA